MYTLWLFWLECSVQVCCSFWIMCYIQWPFHHFVVLTRFLQYVLRLMPQTVLSNRANFYRMKSLLELRDWVYCLGFQSRVSSLPRYFNTNLGSSRFLCFNFYLYFSFYIFFECSGQGWQDGQVRMLLVRFLSFGAFVDWLLLSLSLIRSWKNLFRFCCFSSPLGPVFTTTPEASEGLGLSSPPFSLCSRTLEGCRLFYLRSSASHTYTTSPAPNDAVNFFSSQSCIADISRMEFFGSFYRF